MNTNGRDDGFSLIELLVVIVILGILAAVTVFAVRGIRDNGDTSACAADQKLITEAMESRMALHGSYATEATLKSEGLLREESQLHDVTVQADNFTVVGVGECVGEPALGVAATTTTVPLPAATTTTVAAPPATVPLAVGATASTFLGHPAQTFGSGLPLFLYLGAGTQANAAAAIEWFSFVGRHQPSPVGTYVWVDLSAEGDALDPQDVLDMYNAMNPNMLYLQRSLPPVAIEFTVEAALSGEAAICIVQAGNDMETCS